MAKALHALKMHARSVHWQPGDPVPQEVAIWLQRVAKLHEEHSGGKLDKADALHAVAGFAAPPPQVSNVGTLEGLTGE